MKKVALLSKIVAAALNLHMQTSIKTRYPASILKKVTIWYRYIFISLNSMAKEHVCALTVLEKLHEAVQYA